MNAEIERANAYREMVTSWAFKDFMSLVKEIRDDSVIKQDSVSAENLSIALVAFCKGIRNGFDQLENRVSEILGDAK